MMILTMLIISITCMLLLCRYDSILGTCNFSIAVIVFVLCLCLFFLAELFVVVCKRVRGGKIGRSLYLFNKAFLTFIYEHKLHFVAVKVKEV